jgi:glutathione S-transferase
MTMELYWVSGSPFSWRIMLALELKKIPYSGRLLDFSKGETRRPEYLALNGRGKVPTLKDGAFVLSESIAILAYLDEKYPDPPLFGRGVQEKGLIWRTISECNSYFVPACQEMVLPIYRGNTSERSDDIRRAADQMRAELNLTARWRKQTGLRGRTSALPI